MGPGRGEEIVVLRALVRAHFKDAFAKGYTIEFRQLSTLGHLLSDQSIDAYMSRLMQNKSPSVPDDLIADFGRANQRPLPLPKTLFQDIPGSIAPRAELDEIFGDRSKGWDEYYRRHSRSLGIHELSRVGFSRNMKLAMVYFGGQSDWLAGSGQIYVLRKENGVWEDTSMMVGGMWISQYLRPNHLLLPTPRSGTLAAGAHGAPPVTAGL